DDRTGRRHGHVCLSCGAGLVGLRRLAGGTTLFARFFGGAFATARVGGAPCRAARARDVQWKDVRLAAAGEPFHHDAGYPGSAACGALGPVASSARALEITPRLGAAGRTRTPRAGRAATGLASRW